MVSRNKEIHRSSMTENKKVKLEFIMETVNKVPYRLPSLTGVKNK